MTKRSAMPKRELNGLLGERLEEARSARNLSLSALTAEDEADAASGSPAVDDSASDDVRASGFTSVTSLIRGTTVRARKRLARLPFDRLREQKVELREQNEQTSELRGLRLLDEHTADGTTTRIYLLQLAAEDFYEPDDGEHLMVTAGRIGTDDAELDVGQSHTGGEQYVALDGCPAAAVLVRRSR